MPIIKQPFQSYTLDEEKKKKRDIVSVELNEAQRKWVDEMKATLDIPSDSVCIKILAEFGKNAMVSSFGAKNLEYVCRASRSRFPEKMHKNIKESKNAIQD